MAKYLDAVSNTQLRMNALNNIYNSIGEDKKLYFQIFTGNHMRNILLRAVDKKTLMY